MHGIDVVSLIPAKETQLRAFECVPSRLMKPSILILPCDTSTSSTRYRKFCQVQVLDWLSTNSLRPMLGQKYGEMLPNRTSSRSNSVSEFLPAKDVKC